MTLFTALLLRRKYLLWRYALACERLRCEPWRPWGWGGTTRGLHSWGGVPYHAESTLSSAQVLKCHGHDCEGSHLNLSQASAQRHRTYFLLNNKAVNFFTSWLKCAGVATAVRLLFLLIFSSLPSKVCGKN